MTERVVCGWGGEDWNGGAGRNLVGYEMCYVFIWVFVYCVYTFVKTHLIACFKWAHFIACKLHIYNVTWKQNIIYVIWRKWTRSGGEAGVQLRWGVSRKLSENEVIQHEEERGHAEGITWARALIIFLIFLAVEKFIKTKVIIILFPGEKVCVSR